MTLTLVRSELNALQTFIYVSANHVSSFMTIHVMILKLLIEYHLGRKSQMYACLVTLTQTEKKGRNVHLSIKIPVTFSYIPNPQLGKRTDLQMFCISHTLLKIFLQVKWNMHLKKVNNMQLILTYSWIANNH